ncbi:hypothetical protein [Methylopila sp. M107]|uniref:DUF6968 family protein n=1 Tax=Methylopila sp. M107 TaxID=1101190 RepID=UPI000375E4C4|nr:hypothetical protein [Methylopila sp. M107]
MSTVIAERVLRIVNDDGERDVVIRLFRPEEDDGFWRCAYEIGWPEGARVFYGGGQDAFQAIQLAMQMIGAELYTSEHHKAATLVLDANGAGYGFPVAKALRDLLIGDDITDFG